MDSKSMIITAAVVIVILVAGYYAFSGGAQAPGGTTVVSGPTQTVALQLTDPPQVPNGTTSLMVNYSSAQVQVSGSSTVNGWIAASGAGSIDLLSILNLSQTIATANIPVDARIEMVRFNVTSAKITINGTAYNVTLPSRTLTAHVAQSATVGNSAILLSLSPTVATIVTANSTVFVMVPSLRAVIIGGHANATVGTRRALDAEDVHALENATANIVITSASMNVVGNTTFLSLTVRNQGNASAVLKHVGIFGTETAYVNSSAINNFSQSMSNSFVSGVLNSTACVALRSNATGTSNAMVPNQVPPERYQQDGGEGGAGLGVGANVTAGRSGDSGSENANGTAFRFNGSESEGGDHNQVRIALNASICNGGEQELLRSRLQQQVANFSDEQRTQQERFRFVSLAINGTGGLFLPSDGQEFERLNYSLGAGQNATFTFDAPIAMGEHHLVVVPTAGQQYRLTVGGEEGAYAAANVTAG